MTRFLDRILQLPTIYLVGIISFIILFILHKIQSFMILKRPPRNKIFGYKVFYTDEKNTKKNNQIIYGKILESKEYNLTGKPDYIFKHIFFNRYIPLEVKSGEIKDRDMPYKGDLLQIATYFLLIEEEFHKKPKIGYIVYKDASFIIPNSRSLRRELLKTIKDMRYALENDDKYLKADPSFLKCRYCIAKDTVCEFQNK